MIPNLETELASLFATIYELSGLNEPSDLRHSIQRVITTFKTRTDFDAVGIRLQVGDDFPYYYQEGFSEDFLLKENSLVERADNGGVCRDKDGNVCLECTCGVVISGKTDPTNPLFTKGGSCWTNDSLPILDIPPDEEPRLHPRNQCIHEGYASIALVPIRDKDRIVGLIQLNDRRKERFSLQAIELLERIASHIGAALVRKQSEHEKEQLQEQLVQSQKMESVGRLAGGVAHDYNNMLAVTFLYLELIKQRLNVNDPIMESLLEIEKASLRSRDITRQLLAFSRKQMIAPIPCDLNAIIGSIHQSLARLLGEDIDIRFKAQQDLGRVLLDPSQIDQILVNLAVNARDAMPDGGKLTIETSNVDIDEEYRKEHAGSKPGRYVCLAVSDDGIGMSKETVANIFEPFFTTKETGKGTGLGLATVYGIVKQNNGFIGVYSQIGYGTTFKIYFPLIASDDRADERTESAEVPRGSETILLVEDDDILCRATKAMLEALGYAVTAATSPAEALELLETKEATFDLILTDVVMPGMNGAQMRDRIVELRPGSKVLFMSGYTSDAIVHRGVLDEGIAFVQKPFNVRKLARKIRDVLSQ
jgi:signal transduction histidine kinase